ncbi:MAG: lipopolysaccharide kinase InaA family protein [Coraliomargarita sp.]
MPSSNVSTFSLRVCESAVDTLSAGDRVTLQRGDPLRILPDRREVHAGRWTESNQAVVSKRYLTHKRKERDSQLEWNGLKQLQAAKLPAPQPLYIAEQPEDGSTWVVMRYIENAQPLQTLLSQLSQDETVEVMQQLAQIVQQMHDAGAYQSDQHIGNWAYDGKQVYLLDAGTVRFESTALPAEKRLTDLAALCATLAPCALKAFHRALNNPEHLPALMAATTESHRKRLKKHYQKTRRECTEYGVRNGSAFQGLFSKTADLELVDRFFEQPDALMNQGSRLKSGNTCTVQCFSHNGTAYVLKRYNLKPLLTRIRRNFKESRAMKSWSNAWCLLLANIPTARPVAVYEERTGLLRGLCYLLMEQIDGQLLPEYLAEHDADEEQATVVDSIAEIWTSMRAIRAVHRDLKATNWMVDTNGKAVLFDLDALSFGLPDQAFLQGQAKDYARFMKNWSEQAELTQRFSEKLIKGLEHE